MGTFTVSYLVKTLWNNHKYKLPAGAVALYLGWRWENAGLERAKLMKGQSRMFAHIREGLPKNADSWRY